jgi:hypothetical protein
VTLLTGHKECYIKIPKNWPDDVQVSRLASMKQFIKMKEASMEENENVITKFGLWEFKESSNRL